MYTCIYTVIIFIFYEKLDLNNYLNFRIIPSLFKSDIMSPLSLKNLDFGKYHGLGNDYVIINDIQWQIPEDKKADLARMLCEFHFSIGADGLIYVCKSDKADLKMRIFNDDGSEAEMCGNGIRCFSKYVHENGLCKKNPLTIESLKGTMISKLSIEKDVVKSVEIDMGAPILECEKIPVLGNSDDMNDDTGECLDQKIEAIDKTFTFSAVSMGNPHAVIFVEEPLNNRDLNYYGSAIEQHDKFPKKTNVEFVKIISNTEARLRVFERGVGITHSCGTGTCAAVVAGTLLGHFQKYQPIVVHNDGGDLVITYTGEKVFMKGPVVKSFEGKIDSIEI
ncbi:MAG: diaminopimelate epimerase [Candidatus Lokiarchaeota archaeon]|nr:diaminopimelate epimerase [Candidatus Lokiarchaeota archaeon]MBD3338604.1 diaminopimelate epimerase [Candidatus Lokiarchaeota archaeon]